MPYFSNDAINLLFIHIPKTGGTSLEKYFSNKYSIDLDKNSLYESISSEILDANNIKIDSSLQHLTYQTIVKYKDFFNISMDKLKIITIVRNPYNRLISDLFYLNKIEFDTSKEKVYSIICIYLTSSNDNHSIPQYLFVTDENKELIVNINILKTETLAQDMVNIGYVDFNIKTNSNKYDVNSNDYLNNDSIKLINGFYDYDFTLFGYEKINI